VSLGPTLALDGVGVAYGGVAAVEGIDLGVAGGQWAALIGPNGAGKSSLLRAVAGLTRHTGTVRVNGVDTAALSWPQRAQQVAYVPQQPEVPAVMSVLDYVLLGRTPHIGPFGTESDEDRRVCVDLLVRLDLIALAGRPLATLSGGELQRAVLARALAQQAPVLLLDEPTSALDLGRRVEALELVDELRRERDLAVLSVLHDLTLAGQFADRLALLVSGRLVSVGEPAHVLDADVLARSFGGQVRVLTGEDGRPIVVPQRVGPR
jgi:iron complex transport system ATP-binding protein